MAGFSPDELRKWRQLADLDTEGSDSKLAENNENKNDDKQQQSTYSGNGFQISLNLNKLIEYLFVNHFYFTACLMILNILLYLVVKGYIDLNAIFGIIDLFITKHYFHLISAGAISVIMILTFTMHNKIDKIIKAHNVNKVFSEALINQFNALKNELAELKLVLEAMQSNYNTASISITALTQLISDDVLNTKKIVSLLNSINSTIKKIPNKDTIIDMLTIRTKLLFSDTIEIVSEYITTIIARQPITQIGNGNSNLFNYAVNNVNNNKNKNAFIEEKLRHKIDEIKSQYVIEVFQLSKNTIDDKIRPEINQMLNSAFENIMYLILNPEQQNTLDELIYNIDHCIKQLTSNLVNLYANNLILTSFFDE